MSDRARGSLVDEGGKPSMARRMLVGWGLIVVEVVQVELWVHQVPPEVYTFMAGVGFALVAWAAVPRAGERWAPALAQVLAAIPAALSNIGGRSTSYLSGGSYGWARSRADTGGPGPAESISPERDEYSGPPPGGGER